MCTLPFVVYVLSIFIQDMYTLLPYVYKKIVFI